MTRFPQFEKILVIYLVAEVYGESKERQLCSENALSQVPAQYSFHATGYFLK